MRVSFNHRDYSSILNDIILFRNTRSVLFSNYFGLDKSLSYDSFVSDYSYIIRKREANFYRLYFLSVCICDLSSILSSLDDEVYVINIPTKVLDNDLSATIVSSGFSLYKTYSRYLNKELETGKRTLYSIINDEDKWLSNGYSLCEKATQSDIVDINNLLHSTFDVYTDYLPSDNKLAQMISDGEAYVNRTPSGEVSGVIIAIYTGKMCYQNFWIDKERLGLYLMKNLYHRMLIENIRFTNIWIDDTNKHVIKLHKMLGSLPDGLKDYTFIKNALVEYR